MVAAILVLIIGLVLLGGGLYFLIKLERDFIKNRLANSLDKKELITYGASLGGISLGASLLGLSVFLFNTNWNENRGKNLALFMVGLFFFGLFFSSLWSAFIFHYYKPKQEEKQRRIFTYILFISIPLALAGFLTFMEGIATYLSYPLVNGFIINGSGFKWVHAGDGWSGFHIAWYGVIILFGACVSYWVSDHKFYQEFHKHGILDSLILWAFPAGIIGARIWYVVGNWDREFAGGDFGAVFRIWDGGLTILGGAFAGILVGWLFIKIRRKYIDPRWAIDVCVPTVLLAQAIGRWGNFFNCEVYGQVVNVSDGWGFLPTWIINQMNISNSGLALAEGQINVPLFLIEGILNIAGYFIIVYGVGKGLKKYRSRGDLAALYFVWYGLVRFIMEPLRNSSFNMGSDNSWSIMNSLIYILIGIGLLIGFHLYDCAKKNSGTSFIIPLTSGIIALGATFLPFFPSLTAGTITGSNAAKLLATYSGFSIIFGGEATPLIVAYVFLLLSVIAFFISSLLIALKKEKEGQIASWVGAGLGLVTAIMFFLANKLNSLPSTIEGTTVSYSLSYGFMLLAALALASSLLSLCLYYVKKTPKPLKVMEEDKDV
jgi:phosphatidylglycerol:prolipoprotein diacylglycerol transferase